MTDSVTTLREGVYDITVERRDRARYRVFAVTGAETVLFDTGFEETADNLADRLAAADLAPDHIVVTHADYDHVGGLAGLATQFPDATTHVPVESEVDTAPDDRYADGDDVAGFEAVHVPGHRADNYALVDEARGLLVAGDALIGADWRGLPAGYLLPPEADYSDDHAAAEQNIERLLNYTFEDALVYHGSPVLGDAGAVVDAYVNFPGKPD